MQVPPGFIEYQRHSPVTRQWTPLYQKTEEGLLTIALKVAPQHTNSRGFIHGGVLASLADNCMGMSCAEADPNSPGSRVTTSLALDYLSIAKTGEWVEIRTDFVKCGKRISVATCNITSKTSVDTQDSAEAQLKERVIAKARASFVTV